MTEKLKLRDLDIEGGWKGERGESSARQPRAVPGRYDRDVVFSEILA